MGIFDKIKNSLGLTKCNARRLGGGESDAKFPESFGDTEFTLTFSDDKFGLEVDMFDKNVIVSHLFPGKEAASKGVKEGDVVLAIDGNAVSSPEVFIDILGVIKRPVNIRFKRLFKMTAAEIAVITSAQTKPNKIADSSSSERSVFDKMAGRSIARNETTAEKDHRRAMMAQAATMRETKNPWEKQARAGKKTSSLDVDEVVPDTSGYSEETLRSVQHVKSKEAQLVRELGYNPFAPIVASSSSAKGSAVSSSVGVSSESTLNNSNNPGSNSRSVDAASTLAGRKEVWTTIHQELVEEMCNEALALLLSLCGSESVVDRDVAGNDVGQAAASICIATTAKMLENIKNNPREPKFRSVRVHNHNFNTKVYSVPGGAQLFMAAGFQLYTEGGDGSIDQESFLRHDMSYMKTRMLVYVLDRLKELQRDG